MAGDAFATPSASDWAASASWDTLSAPIITTAAPSFLVTSPTAGALSTATSFANSTSVTVTTSKTSSSSSTSVSSVGSFTPSTSKTSKTSKATSATSTSKTSKTTSVTSTTSATSAAASASPSPSSNAAAARQGGIRLRAAVLGMAVASLLLV